MQTSFNELIKKGLLIKKNIPKKDSEYFGIKSNNYYRLKDDFENEFLNHVFILIDKNVMINTKHHYDVIKNELTLYPKEVLREKIISKIENISKLLNPYSLDKQTERLMILDFFSYDDFLKFSNNQINVLSNENLSEFIKDKALNNVIELLKKDYSQIEITTKKKTTNPILALKSNLDLLRDLELYPNVKYDLVDLLDDIKNSYSESLMISNKAYLTEKLYLQKKPNIFYIRELERVLNTTNATIQKINLELKKYPDYTIEKYGRQYTPYDYFKMCMLEFKTFYNEAKENLNEIKSLQTKQSSNNKTLVKHPFKNAPYEYCIIAHLFATNDVKLIDKKEFRYNDKTYYKATHLNKAINESFNFDKQYNFNGYLTNYKQKNGDKNLLKTKDINGNPDATSINRLRIIKKYFDENNIQVKNKDFIKAFKQLDNN